MAHYYPIFMVVAVNGKTCAIVEARWNEGSLATVISRVNYRSLTHDFWGCLTNIDSSRTKAHNVYRLAYCKTLRPVCCSDHFRWIGTVQAQFVARLLRLLLYQPWTAHRLWKTHNLHICGLVLHLNALHWTYQNIWEGWMLNSELLKYQILHNMFVGNSFINGCHMKYEIIYVYFDEIFSTGYYERIHQNLFMNSFKFQVRYGPCGDPNNCMCFRRHSYLYSL